MDAMETSCCVLLLDAEDIDIELELDDELDVGPAVVDESESFSARVLDESKELPVDED